jgi:hypothetical protein
MAGMFQRYLYSTIPRPQTGEPMKHTKQTAGKKGGKATVAKLGRGHMAAIGKRGAETTWQRYYLTPAGTSDFAMICKDTGEVIAFLSGKPWG